MSLRPPNVTFHDGVETALRDANLHVALDRATSRFTTLRAAALASLPDATLPAFFAARPDLARAGSNVVIITGPSRTADIELTPVYGVHGPKALHVILLDRG